MATITLPQLLEAMKKPMSRPVKMDYIKFVNGYKSCNNYEHKLLNPPTRTHIQACAIGEAALQLARMAHECILGNVGTDYFDMFEALAECVEGTTLEFWQDAEKNFCFPDDGIFHRSRRQAIIDAAKAHNLQWK